MEDLVFGACTGISVVSALMVVTRRNPIYSALFLLITLLALAGLTASLAAPFPAAMHVLVYSGAIMVLFVFVIMLLSLREEEMGPEYPLPFRLLAAGISVATFAGLAWILGGLEFPAAEKTSEGFGGLKSIAAALYGPQENAFILPFELVSVLILVAILGGIILARRRESAPR